MERTSVIAKKRHRTYSTDPLQERAVLIAVDSARAQHWSADASLDELAMLARTAGARPVARFKQRLRHPDPGSYIGKGKLQEVIDSQVEQPYNVAIFDDELSPAQQRRLEGRLGVKVIDRTALILDIFAQRARTREGKLQVALAQHEYLLPRLRGQWSHLERMEGAIGLRGPGETQLETDRRLIGRRIKRINERLGRVRRRRRQGARSRNRALLSTVSLVGYTNTGKSTLFNRLTGSEVYAADQLFATLDTTLRTIDVPGEHPLVLSDTVGFIRGLPPELIAAFQATLEETRDANLLIHVIDASSEERALRIADVQGVLQRIGAGAVPVLEVYSKIDRIPGRSPGVERAADGRVRRVWLSGLDGAGCHLLIDAIAEHLNQSKDRRWLMIDAPAGRFRALLYECGAVNDEVELQRGGWVMEVTLSDTRWQVFSTTPEIAAHVSEIAREGSLSEFDFKEIERQTA